MSLNLIPGVSVYNQRQYSIQVIGCVTSTRMGSWARTLEGTEPRTLPLELKLFVS